MICKTEDCRKPTKAKGLCRSCAAKAYIQGLDKKCKNPRCNNLIRVNNKTDECYQCKRYPKKPADFNKGSSWYKSNHIKCFNKDCGKTFRARKNQHPKYSFCPTCKARAKHISNVSRWTNRGGFV